MQMFGDFRIILCIGCGQQLRVPLDKPRLKITCPTCRYSWIADTSSPFTHSRDLPYKIVDLEQGTRSWLDWRCEGIGASDAPTIMGDNPWKTRQQLLVEKKHRRDVAKSFRMAKGTELEPEARRRYESIVGIKVFPKCIQSTKIQWLRASLDGMSHDGRIVVEIKCGESAHRNTRHSRRPPKYYYGQFQHILAVTNLKELDFFCYWPGRNDIHIPVKRDETTFAR